MDEFKKLKKTEATIYNTAYLFDTLAIIDQGLKELSAWSAYNEDQFNHEIFVLKDQLTELKNKAYLTGGKNLYRAILEKGGEK